MSLNEARRVAKRARKSGRKVEIRRDRQACLARNPNLHPMAGGEVVIDLSTGQFIWPKN